MDGAQQTLQVVEDGAQ
jgi:uncharacterized protein (DUF1778 family)